MSTANTRLILNQDQVAANAAILQWFFDPNAPRVFKLRGAAGTGKSYLVSEILQTIEATSKASELFGLGAFKFYVTATTNQAAEELHSKLKNTEVVTIHSFLQLTVYDNKLIQRKNGHVLGNITTGKDILIVIDEASYVCKTLMGYINLMLKLPANSNIKVLFVYDAKQLLPVNHDHCVIDAEFLDAETPHYELTINERFINGENSMIANAAARLCEVIADDSQDIPDLFEGVDVEYISSSQALDVALGHFREGEMLWNPSHCVYMAHTNVNVVDSNDVIFTELYGTGHYMQHRGLHLVNNSILYQHNTNNVILRNNHKVILTNPADPASEHVYEGVSCYTIGVTTSEGIFHSMRCAVSATQRLQLIKKLQKAQDYYKAGAIRDYIADLRLTYCSTVYKAQGKTCNYALVDVADILDNCRTLDEAKRLLYVAVTRARRKVYLIWE